MGGGRRCFPQRGSCQNFGPFLGSLKIRCRITFRTPKTKPMILTATHTGRRRPRFTRQVCSHAGFKSSSLRACEGPGGAGQGQGCFGKGFSHKLGLQPGFFPISALSFRPESTSMWRTRRDEPRPTSSPKEHPTASLALATATTTCSASSSRPGDIV